MQKRINGKIPLHKLDGVKLVIVPEDVLLRKGKFIRAIPWNLTIKVFTEQEVWITYQQKW